ncbi:TonB-dependent receptor plug domain-containing protein [Flavobacterium pedocola]
MKKLLFLTLSLITLCSEAQTKKDSTKVKHLDEVQISTPKYLKPKKDIPQQTETVSKKEMDFQNFQNPADILGNSGIAAVQKSQQGGGSPTLRGFEASRILLLVDGIRMNNLIFRAGHLQNILTVDQNMIENMDIFYGPSSTVFGSDALGGAINMQTKKARLLAEAKNKFSGAASTRYSSVNEEKAIHFDLNYAKENWASLTSFSFNDFGDLKMGRQRNHNNAFYGEREQYIETIDGTDVMVTNSDKYVQKFSAYKQYNFIQKFVYKQSNSNVHDLNLQYSTTSDIPRYDRLTDANAAGLRNAEWFYGPQKRILAAYTFSRNKAFLNSDLKLTASYQKNEESRHNRRYQRYDLENRIEKTAAFALNLDLKKTFSKSELLYGIESYYDKANSTAYSNNIQTGAIGDINTRYPNGDNNMFRNDLYAIYTGTINEKTSWTSGARIGYVTLNSTIDDDTFFPLPFDKIKQSNFTYSGSLGLIHNPSETVRLTTNIGTGFRAPNIDDLAKIFESGSGTVIVPNEDLKPEKTVTTDLGFTITSKNKRFQWDNVYYYTRFIDAIVTDKFLYNGQSTIDYNGQPSVVVANQNKGKAFITGISSTLKTYVYDNLLLNASFHYTLGRSINEETGAYSPLDHIPPYYGKLGLNYTLRFATFEAYMLYNGKKHSKDYSSSGEDNPQYAPQGGMPAWETYNFKTSFAIYKGLQLMAGVENILDTQYRTFASGINAPGRNFYGTLHYTF